MAGCQSSPTLLEKDKKKVLALDNLKLLLLLFSIVIGGSLSYCAIFWSSIDLKMIT